VVDLAAMLDSMILKVFSNLNDSLILKIRKGIEMK